MSDLADFVIEPLTRARAEREADAVIALGRDLAWDDWTPQHLLEERPEKWQLSLIASRDGAPVGYAISSRRGDDVHIHHVVVDPMVRGAGLGRALLERVARLAVEAGAERVTLKAYHHNTEAIRLFERLGYRQVGSDEALRLMARDVSRRSLP